MRVAMEEELVGKEEEEEEGEEGCYVRGEGGRSEEGDRGGGK